MNNFTTKGLEVRSNGCIYTVHDNEIEIGRFVPDTWAVILNEKYLGNASFVRDGIMMIEKELADQTTDK